MDLANIDPIWIVVAVAVIALLVLLAAVARSRRQRRREHLRSRFGPEYERTVQREGSKKRAEQELVAREARHDELELRDLTDDDRERFRARWDELQTSFVDGPASTARAAETLLDDVARQRGYPDADPERRLRDLSVDHPQEVDGYRRALPSEGGKDRGRGETDSTEALRSRVLAARGLFDAMVAGGDRVDAPPAPFDPAAHDHRDDPGRSGSRDVGGARHGSVTHRDAEVRPDPTVDDTPPPDEPVRDDVPPPGAPVADGVEPVGEPARTPLDDEGAAPRSTERTVTPPPPPPGDDADDADGEPSGVLGPDGRPVERHS